MPNYKIGFVLDDGLDKPDGVQQYILTLGEYYSAQGHEVHYLVGQTKRTDIANVHSMSRNVKVMMNGNRMSMPLPASKRKIKKLLIDENFDVLHIQVPYSPFMGAKVILAAPKSTAIIGTFHIAPNNGIVHFGTSLLGIWLHRSLKRFDQMVSVSTAAQAFSAVAFGVKSKVVPNAVDYKRFANGKPLAKYNDSKTTILYLGRMVKRKGPMTLLKAVAQLKDDKTLPPFRVVMCGKGHLLAQIKAYIKEHRLEDYVELAGFVNEEQKVYYHASADISVFPSSGGESFGIVLIEAMASGRSAVLAGDNPGYRSVLGVKPELLFDTKSPDALAKLLKKYLKDTKLRKETAEWGQSYVQKFDVPVVAGELLEVYGEALRKKR